MTSRLGLGVNVRVHKRSHRKIDTIIRDNVAAPISTFRRAFGDIELAGKTFLKNVAAGRERPVGLQSSIVSDLYEYNNMVSTWPYACCNFRRARIDRNGSQLA